MSNHPVLSPEDLLLWQQRAPRASYWLRVSDSHPFIDGGRPLETALPPPYTPVHIPAPAILAYLGNDQLVPSIPSISKITVVFFFGYLNLLIPFLTKGWKRWKR